MAPTNRGVNKAVLPQSRTSTSGPASDLRTQTAAATPLYNVANSGNTMPLGSFASLTIPFPNGNPNQSMPNNYFNQQFPGPQQSMNVRSPDQQQQMMSPHYFTNPNSNFQQQQQQQQQQQFSPSTPMTSPPPQNFFPGNPQPLSPSMFANNGQQPMASFEQQSQSQQSQEYSQFFGGQQVSPVKAPDQQVYMYSNNNDGSLYGGDFEDENMEVEAYNMLSSSQDGALSPAEASPSDDMLSPLTSGTGDCDLQIKPDPGSPSLTKTTAYAGRLGQSQPLASSKEKEQNKQKLYRNRKTEFTKKMQDELLSMGMLPSTRITHAPEIMSKTADTLREYRELLELLRAKVDGMPPNLAQVNGAVRKLLNESAGMGGANPLLRPAAPQQQQQQQQQMHQPQPTHGFKPDLKIPLHPLGMVPHVQVQPHHQPHQQQFGRIGGMGMGPQAGF